MMDEAVQPLQGCEARPVPLLEKLKRQKEALEAKLAEVQDAIDILEANPAFVSIIDTLGKVVRIY